jgi:hypothetical protein
VGSLTSHNPIGLHGVLRGWLLYFKPYALILSSEPIAVGRIREKGKIQCPLREFDYILVYHYIFLTTTGIGFNSLEIGTIIEIKKYSTVYYNRLIGHENSYVTELRNPLNVRRRLKRQWPSDLKDQREEEE